MKILEFFAELYDFTFSNEWLAFLFLGYIFLSFLLIRSIEKDIDSLRETLSFFVFAYGKMLGISDIESMLDEIENKSKVKKDEFFDGDNEDGK